MFDELLPSQTTTKGAAMNEHRPRLAEDYNLHASGLDIDGTPFPWLMASEGPRVEAVDERQHVLWVPVMVLKPAPGVWDESGEALEPEPELPEFRCSGCDFCTGRPL